jgi:kynureninase
MPTLSSALTVARLSEEPNPLALHYTRFRVSERLLLTGHSHQAWPDAGFQGQLEAWTDAAEWVDEKWARAAERADRVRRGYARLLGAEPREVALGQNTHELVIRFLSALPLGKRPRLLTTDGEFHTLRRQLDRLAETGALEIVKVAAHPAATRLPRRSSPRCCSGALTSSPASVACSPPAAARAPSFWSTPTIT